MIMLRGFVHAGRPHPRPSARHGENASAVDGQDGAARPDDGADDERYRLISISAADAPEGCTGANWFVYRITQGTNGITGYRRGPLENVNADVQSIVTALNGRRQWGNTKTPSKYQRRAAAAAHRKAGK